MSAELGLWVTLTVCEWLACQLNFATNALHQFGSNELQKFREITISKSSLGLWMSIGLDSSSCCNHLLICDLGHVTTGSMAVGELVSTFFELFALFHPRERSNCRRTGDNYLIAHFAMAKCFISATLVHYVAFNCSTSMASASSFHDHNASMRKMLSLSLFYKGTKWKLREVR